MNKISHIKSRASALGFTLVELLMSMAVSAILLTILASITSSGASLTTLIHDRLAGQQDAKAALDYIQRDFDSLTPAETSRTTFTVLSETVDGPGGVGELSSFWIMMLSRPVSSAERGTIRAVSYRLRYIDPMTPGGANLRPALYRTELTTADATTSFLDVADLHADFWTTEWPVYEAANSGSTILGDYLVENIVDVQVTLNYLDSLGDPVSNPLPVGSHVNWVGNGFQDVPAPATATANTPVSVTVIFTSLRPEGADLYEIGGLTIADAIERHGIVQSRTFPIYPSYIN